MATSERTKLCKKRYIIFSTISFILWIGAAIFCVCSAFTKAFGTATDEAGMPILSDQFKALLLSIGTTLIIALILTIFMSNKIRTTIWMGAVILGTICYGQVAMYIMFSLWFIDEYVFHLLAKHYKLKLSMNKEIDLRG